MKRNITIILAATASLLASACGGRTADDPRERFTATILPVKYIVEQITGDDFAVDVLVPSGASPETFEPTPKQYIRLNESRMIFSTGLIDFETALLSRLDDRSSVVNLSRGIELMAGSCSHTHAAVADTPAGEGIMHGVDPHIWTSPRELLAMARNACDAVMERYPDSVKYRVAYERLAARLVRLDRTCREMCERSPARAFVVYHPALTYFARAYGLDQIAVEEDGKEPSAKDIARIIDKARAASVTCLMYQSQYPRSTVEIIARDMGVECREIDPLAENAEENIMEITRIITGG